MMLLLQTYRNVDIDGTIEDSIIMFYNKIFMPNMKTYILQFQPKNQVSCNKDMGGGDCLPSQIHKPLIRFCPYTNVNV